MDLYGKMLLHGKGYDRWFDKSFNLCVGTNGRVRFFLIIAEVLRYYGQNVSLYRVIVLKCTIFDERSESFIQRKIMFCTYSFFLGAPVT